MNKNKIDPFELADLENDEKMLEKFEKMLQKKSNCCNYNIIENTDICSKCREHCEVI